MSEDRSATTGIATDRGRFKRQVAQFRNTIVADPNAEFSAEPDRYHLYISWACPWAHRTALVRKLRGLEEVISLNVVDYYRDEKGWRFTGRAGSTLDTVNGKEFLSEVYRMADPEYALRPTTPVLWDKKNETLVNNESVEIIRMMDVGFAALGNPDVNLYPQEHAEEIDEVIADLYDRVNNGVYKSGFARTQEAYEEAVTELFEALDHYESILGSRRYLVGDVMTEADICFFVTLIRFDPVYYSHFKCAVRRIVDYPNLWAYTRDLYQHPGVAETVHFDHIKGHYFETHKWLNPSGIVPLGPVIDYDEPVDR